MSSLIKNELSKIFHKKAIYIVLIIILGFTILNAVLEKVLSNNDFFDNIDKESIKASLEMIDKNNPADKDQYISLSAELEAIELAEKYDKNSWQNFIIKRDAQSIIERMIRYKGTEDYEYSKEKYDEFIEKLESDDWKTFANSELEMAEYELSQANENNGADDNQLESAKDSKKALEWRLEKDIPYGNNAKSNIIENWIANKALYRDLVEQEKTKKLSYDEKIKKQETEACIKLYENAIENNVDSKAEDTLINGQTAIASTSDAALVETNYQYSMFITIAVVIIAGTIVSEESNKGTIKLLLVRPYKRTKILCAKFIACLITLLVTLVATTLIQFVVGGFANGFNNYLGNIIIYNFSKGSVETISTFAYLLLTTFAILPQILLLSTLAFTLSTVFNSSPVAIAIPLLGGTVAGIINQLFLVYKKAEFLKFFVTPNWDLSIYLFGKLPMYESLNLGFSIAICLMYFIALLALSTAVFKKRDIKNV